MRLRRRLAQPPIELFRRSTSILQSRKAWESYEYRLQKAGLPAPLNPIGTSMVQRSEQINSVCCSVTPPDPSLGLNRVETTALGAFDSVYTDDLDSLPGIDQLIWWEVWLRSGQRQTFAALAARL